MAEGRATSRVRIAAFNILYGRYGSPEEIGRWMREVGPDLVCLCECPGEYEWLDRAADAMELPHYVVGVLSSGIDIRVTGRTMKFKAVFSRTVLDPLPELLCDGRGWSNGSATRARTMIGERNFVVHSLHIAGNPGEDSESLERGHSHTLAESVGALSDSDCVLMAGDFNNRIDEPALLLLEDAGLRPTWRDVDIDLDAAFSLCPLTPTSPDNRLIDHIYYDVASGGRAVDGGTLERTQPLSDHKPVWAEIEYTSSLTAGPIPSGRKTEGEPL